MQAAHNKPVLPDFCLPCQPSIRLQQKELQRGAFLTVPPCAHSFTFQCGQVTPEISVIGSQKCFNTMIVTFANTSAKSFAHRTPRVHTSQVRNTNVGSADSGTRISSLSRICEHPTWLPIKGCKMLEDVARYLSHMYASSTIIGLQHPTGLQYEDVSSA